MGNELYIDIETRSRLNIKEVSLLNYAQNCEILCISYSIDGEPVVTLTRETGFEKITSYLTKHYKKIAHNYGFELAVLREAGLLGEGGELNWECTQALAMYFGLPGDLKNACLAMDLNEESQKDAEGAKVMLALASPNKKTGEFIEDPALFELLYSYCEQDVYATIALKEALPFIPGEVSTLLQVYRHMDEVGIPLDMTYVRNSLEAYEKRIQELEEEFMFMTGGLRVTQGVKITKLLKSTYGVQNLQEQYLKQFLQDNKDPWLDKLLKIKLECAGASVNKYKQAVNLVEADGRVRRQSVIFGAHTHRPTGRKLQALNMKRPPEGFDMDKHADKVYKSPEKLTLDEVNNGVRGIICNPTKEIGVIDFSQMEPRIASYITGQMDNLQVYLDGGDLYAKIATDIFGVPVTKKTEPEKRYQGKECYLAFQYGGSIGSLLNSAYKNSMSLEGIRYIASEASPHEVEKAENTIKWLKRFKKFDSKEPHEILVSIDVLKQRFREKNPQITSYWKRLSDCFMFAFTLQERQVIRRNGFEVKVMPIDDFMAVVLPGGTARFYPKFNVKILTKEEMEEDGTFNKFKLFYSKRTKAGMKKTFTYGGKLFENLIQSIAAKVMHDKLIAMVAEGIPVFMSVYDETVFENGPKYYDLVDKIMREPLSWAPGLPIGTEGMTVMRYRK